MIASFLSIFSRFFGLVLGISTTGQNFPPPLPKEEEAKLFLRLAETGDEAARSTLIEHNLRLVAHIVKKYYTSYQSPDELISIGSIGLIKAIDSFKCENGARFATYGSRCIQNEILMFFRAQKKRGGEISLSETIDVDRDGNPLTYIDIISEEETLCEDLALKVQTERLRDILLSSLDPREREIILLRYGLTGEAPLTQRDVAAKLSISRSYVSRIEKKALAAIRERFGDCGSPF